MASRQKVFGIGFQKTATSSLAAALYILGYNVTGFFGAHDADIGEKVYAKGDGWKKLCPFMGQEIPPLEFPSQNGAADRSNQVMKRGINYLKIKLPLNNDPESVHDQLLAQIQRNLKEFGVPAEEITFIDFFRKNKVDGVSLPGANGQK